MKQVKAQKKIKTEGLVIKTVDVNDSNRLIVILTNDMGIITAFAGGVKKPTSKLSAGCGLFVYSFFGLTKTGSNYRVDEVIPKELFYKIRYDIEGVALASYFCELVSGMSFEGDCSNELLRPLLNALYLITQKNKPLKLIKAVTEMRIMSAAGFMPDLSEISCGHNYENSGVYLDFIGGVLICGNCAKKINGFKGKILNKTVLDALRYILNSDVKKCYSFNIPQNDLNNLCYITENYVIEQTERKCKTLSTLKELLQ